MSNFLIFKAAFNGSTTPAIGTYTAEGATAQFNINASLSPDYYLYNTTGGTAVQWFVPTAETADFEFVADILTRSWTNRVTYFIIADSTGATRLRMWSVNDNWYFENSDSTETSGNPEYIGVINPTTSGGFGVFHNFRVRVRKLTESSSSVEVYVDGTLKLTATAGATLVTCAKIGFVGGVNTFGPGTDAGVKNAYVYDLSGGDVIDRGVLSGAFNRFISWMKSKFALKSDIPTVNNATLTIQQNGTNVQTFTANQSTNATANIQCVDLSTAQTVAGNKTLTGTTSFTSSPGIARNANPFLLMTTNDYDKGTAPASDMGAGVRFLCNPDAAVTNKITGGLDVLYYASGYNVTGLNARNYDENSNHRNYSVSLRVSNDSAVPIDFVPSVNATIDLGSSTAQWNNAYIKALTVNGTAAGDILTHNASEFVDLTSAQTIAGDKDFTGTTGTHDVIPAATDTYDLGSSAKEYNNAYIKSYYYNGTQWGLDQVNTWTAHQKVVGNNSRGLVSIYNPAYTKGSALSVTDLSLGTIFMGNGGQEGLANSLGFVSTDLASSGARTLLSLSAMENTASSSARTNVAIQYDKNDAVDPRKVIIQGSIFPHADATYSLGTSTYKWKSLNGINPSALSLQSTNLINIASNITVLDGTTANTFTPQVNGWLLINGTGTANEGYIYAVQGRIGMISANNTAMLKCAVLIPVVAGVEVTVYCKLSTLTWANIAPCQGNI